MVFFIWQHSFMLKSSLCKEYCIVCDKFFYKMRNVLNGFVKKPRKYERFEQKKIVTKKLV